MSVYAVNGKTPVAAWIPTRSQNANDLVGTNNGVLTNGAAIVSDLAAGGTHAFSFDGVNDLVEIGSGIFTSYPVAVSLWFRGSSFGTFQAFFSCGENSVNNHIFFGFASKKVRWNPRRNLTDVVVDSSGDYDDGNWHHAVGVSLSASSHALYVDGSLVGSSSTNLTSFPALNRAAIGCLRRNTNASFFDGNVDDVRVVNLAIDASDVTYLWNNGTGRGRITATAYRRRMMMMD